MPRLVGIEPVVPQFCYGQSEARDFARHLFSASTIHVERLLPIFENTTITRRHFCMPAEWYHQDHSFEEKNRLYLEHAIQLAATAVRKVCAAHGIAPHDLDHIFFVSSTGLATPSIDAHLFNLLQFKSSVRRSPIWGLGCAGGISGLARAADWLMAYPAKLAVVVALELCSLTFIRNDFSKGNFVAISLFADGAAAALLAGDAHPCTGTRSLELLGTEAVTWRDSLDVMGWDLHAEGLKVIFSRDIPTIVRESAKPGILQFLAGLGKKISDIDVFLSHPGGAKVISAYMEALELPAAKTKYMWQVLSRYGNMSSATVLFVIDAYLRSSDYRSGDLILSTTLGPGFSSEMLLGRCR